MRQMKRSQVYVASNVSFDPKSIMATSYGWWTFVRIIKGQTVFNQYRYSNSTAKHQYKVRRLMDDLGIKIDRFVSVRESLFGVESIMALNKLVKAQAVIDFEKANAKRIKRNENARLKRQAKKTMGAV